MNASFLVNSKYTFIPNLKFDIDSSCGVSKSVLISEGDVISCVYCRDAKSNAIIGKVVKIGVNFNSSLGAVGSTAYIQIDGSDKYAGQVEFIKPSEVRDLNIISTSGVANNIVCSVDNETQRITLVRENEIGNFQYSTDGITWKAVCGPKGASAYESAVKLGYKGTEEEWLRSLIGPPGPVSGTQFGWVFRSIESMIKSAKDVPENSLVILLADPSSLIYRRNDYNIPCCYEYTLETECIDGEDIPVIPGYDYCGKLTGYKPYMPEVTKTTDYLYQIEYSTYDYKYANDVFKHLPANTIGGACSAFRKGNFIGRNFDWIYSEGANFLIRTNASENRHATIGLAWYKNITNKMAASGEYSEDYKILPFRTLDCINDAGVYCSDNVVPVGDKGRTTGTHPGAEVELSAFMVVRYVCDYANSARHAISLLQNANIYATSDEGNELELHYLICDKYNTYIVEFDNNVMKVMSSTDAEFDPIPTSNDIMTNFYLTNWKGQTAAIFKGNTIDEVNASGLTPHADGLERYDIITNNIESVINQDVALEVLNEVKYTNLYKNTTVPTWWSELTGSSEEFGELTIRDGAAKFVPLYNFAKSKYENRVRDDGFSWQTVHACAYDIKNKSIKVKVDEKDYVYTFYLNGADPVNADNVTIKKNDNSELYAVEMVGATEDSNGASGIVPAPTKEDKDKFLSGDGTWKAQKEGITEFDQLDNRPRYNSVPITSSTNIPQVKTYEWDNKQEHIDNLEEIIDNAAKGALANDALNGHTVKKDVPENAIFTDTIYDDSDIKNRLNTIEGKETAWDGAVEALDGHTVGKDVPEDAVFTDTIYDDATIKARVSTIEGKEAAWDDAVEALGGHTVGKDVPSNAKFTDTVYDDTAIKNRVTAIEGKEESWDGAVAALDGHTVAKDVPANAVFSDTKPKYNGAVVTNSTDIPEVKTDVWDGKLDDAPSDDNSYVRKNGAWAKTTGAVLSSELTTVFAVGGIPAGKTYAAGTLIETIIRDILYVPTYDLYVGQVDNVSSRAFKELDSQSLIDTCAPKAIADTPVVWSPTLETQVFFMLVKDGSENLILNGSLVSGGLTTQFSNDDITNPASTSWKGNGHAPVVINGTTYKVFGFPMNSWSTTDVMTINFNK